MFAEWVNDKSTQKGFVATAFKKIAAFIEALGNALRGNGFTTADSIFASIDSGEVGQRAYEVGDTLGDGGGFAEVRGKFKLRDVAKAITGILAYHGSPHDFDRSI